jgi:hypothetical protein
MDFLEKLKGYYGSKRGVRQVLIAAVVVAFIFLNAIVYTVISTYGLYLYTSEQLDFSISPATYELFKDDILAGKKVKITFLMAKEELKAHTSGAYVHRTAEELKSTYPDFVELEYVNIYTGINQDEQFVDLTKYKTAMNGGVNQLKKSSVIFSSSDGAYRVVTDGVTTAGFSDFYTLTAKGEVTSYNGQQIMTGMMKWVLSSEHKTAYFTNYHGETADPAFGTLLLGAGYNIEYIDLRENDVPEDCTLLVISHPTNDFETSLDGSIESEMSRLRDYYAAGGNVYISLDPYASYLPSLEGFLKENGIELMTDENRLNRGIVRDTVNAVVPSNGFTFTASYANNESAGAIKDRVGAVNNGGMLIRECGALKVNSELGAVPLFVAGSGATLYSNDKVISSDGSYNLAAYNKNTNGGGLFAIATVYFTASDAIVSGGYANADIILGVFEKVFGDTDLPFGTSAITFVSGMLDNLPMWQANIYTAIIMAIPVAIGAVGLVIHIKRKHR